MKTLVIIGLLAGTLSANLFAAQPLDARDKSTIAAYEALAMDESDLEDVSGVAGPNVLNIHGSSAGGLMQESNDEPEDPIKELNEWGFNEGKKSEEFAERELTDIEKSSDLNQPSVETTLAINDSPIELDSSIQGEVTTFKTSSEINYKKDNFQHNTKQLDGDAISISRELQIDLLKIENLGGDDFEQGRNAGNIFIFDWSSRGGTTLTPR